MPPFTTEDLDCFNDALQRLLRLHDGVGKTTTAATKIEAAACPLDRLIGFLSNNPQKKR